jgi:hypothetical protein
MKRQNYAIILLLIIFGIFVVSCGKAEYAGYTAPAGSEITMPESGVVVIPAGASMYVIIDILVEGPVFDPGRTVNEFPEGEILTTNILPLSNIQVQFICFNCEIYDKPSDIDYIAADTPLEAKPSPYLVKTNSQGGYQLAVLLTSPADIGLTTYKAKLSGNINAASDETEFTVNAE